MNNNCSPFSLKGKIVLITGASSGIGMQCAVDLAKAGATVAIFGRNKKRLDKVLETCLKYSPNSEKFECDVTDKTKMEECVSKFVNNVGPIDGLIYSAGIEKTLPFNKLTQDDYLNIYAVNVVGALSLVSIISKKQYRGVRPHYVLISSITSIVGRPGVAAYAASKGALISAVRTLALELAPKHITINCISPGTVLTPLIQSLLSNLTEDQQAERKAGFPLGIGLPSDISNASMFFLSDASRWITGQNIVIDGGYTIK